MTAASVGIADREPWREHGQHGEPGNGGGVAASELAWREVFVDAPLQRTIELALSNNRNLRVAALNIEQVVEPYIREVLPEGWLTEVAPGTSYGDALLVPTVLYSPVTEALWREGITVHYAANITGHGWRKLMRHPGAFTYRFHTLPPVPPVLRFIQQHAGHDDREAYSTLNMGAGFALFVAASGIAFLYEALRRR